MTITTDDSGQATGSFTVPPVTTGTKLVEAVGDQGTLGTSTFTGKGTITTEERRRVTTITTRRFDPLAQTFTLEEGRHIGGIDLWFDVIGTKRVVVQVRTTQLGLPTQVVLAQRAVQPDAIKADGHTRIQWSPVWLDAGVEFAVVLLTDDAETSVRIAELGKYDSSSKRWITSQPYHVGVLLSSSNAVTWTPHQNRDLTFRLLAAKFTEQKRSVDLGELDVENASDLMALANVERISSDTDVVFTFTDEDGNETQLSEDMPLELKQRLKGKIHVKALLSGNDKNSTVLYPGIQIVSGDVSHTADYITRAIPAGNNTKIHITYEAELTGTADVIAYVQTGKEFQKVDISSTENIGDQWVERNHILKHFNEQETRVKLVLSGDDQNRPKVRNLRVVIT